MKRIAVIGAGNWGTALAATLAKTGHAVTLWAYEPEVVESIRAQHENALFMPGVKLPESIEATNDLGEALEQAEIVLTVMPSHVCRPLYESMLHHLGPEMIFVSATKGIDSDRLMRMSELIHSVVGGRFAPRLCTLSGPSFAQEVVRGDPTAVVVASQDRKAAQLVQKEFSSRTLRIYTSNDVVGVEIGGAVKNIIAIAVGVIAGLGLGHNPVAALITRGLAEISRLACACGAKRLRVWGTSSLPARATSAGTARWELSWAEGASFRRLSAPCARWRKASRQLMPRWPWRNGAESKCRLQPRSTGYSKAK
jgi:glycerol-3-phosphate dehydrogenase (NAD(P)+)